MTIRFLESAQVELDEAIAYYDGQEPGLGGAFLREVLDTLRRISAFPRAWQRISRRTRRCQARRYPYGIIYQVRPDEILVVAVASLHRKPGYWKDRM